MRNKGAALVDYIIPTALIGILFGLAIFSMAKGNYILNFLAGSAEMNVNKQTKTVTLGNLQFIKAGDLGGTPDKPVVQCIKGTCNIDYGEFVLNGIPEDFNEYISSTASSGGTDKLVDLLKQMAAQLEQKGEAAKALELKNIANLGHFLSKTQKNLEAKFNDCSKIPDNVEKMTCTNNYMNSSFKELNITIPDEVKQLCPDFTDDKNIVRFQNLNRIIVIEQMKKYNYDYQNNHATENNCLLYKMDNLKDSMNSDTTYNPAMTSVANTLISSVYQLNDNFYNLSHSASNVKEYGIPATFPPKTVYWVNPNTGLIEEYSSTTSVQFDDFNRVLHPETSKFTNYNSRLICTTGKWNSTEKKCM